MAQIEVWWKAGKGLIGSLHRMKAPVFVVFFEDADGNTYPIFEGNNNVSIGYYKVKGYFPYARNADEKIVDFGTPVLVKNNDQVINVLFEHIVGLLSCFTYEDHVWESYLQKHADKLTRHVGWLAETALQMLND